MHVRSKLALALPLVLLAAAGCDRGAEEAPAVSTGDPAAGDAPAWLLTAAPEGAQPVSEVKKSAKEGDRVVVRGVIGGRHDPLTEDGAVFVLMDPAIPSCADNPEDNCPTPWDYCCETPETIAANNATVQVVGEDGGSVVEDLTAAGLSPLDEVVVVGTVGPRASEQVLVLKATGVHRVGG